MKTWKLTLVANLIWDADDYLHDSCCNPRNVDYYLLRDDSEEELKKVYDDIDADSDIYNDAVICRDVELDENDILDNGFDSIEEFEEELELALDDEPKRSSLHELGQYILNYSDWISLDVPNYDFDESIEGSIVICWSWYRYIGYARDFEQLRYAYHGETKRLLTKADRTFVKQYDVVMTADEIAACDDLEQELYDRLIGDWKWRNKNAVERAISEISGSDDNDDDDDE